ncbi:MAG TPA: TraR/DksA C4-type zinc finger protein [Chitinophagaceae bacterium]|nr:TraR/DksA C4-type zinc finger protein [Chitinophagaceae bacterium]
MPNKKKPAPKKTAHKKAAKPAAKGASHKAAKPAAKKPASHKAAKPAAKKPVHPKPVKHVTHHVPHKPAKPVAKNVKPVHKPIAAKPEPRQTTPVPAPKPPAKKDSLSSLVSIKPGAKPVIKKEPPKPGKIVIPKTTAKSAVKYEPDFTKSVLDSPMHEQNGPSMRYSDNDLVEFREIINKKLDAAKKELAYLQGLITRRDEGGDMDEARYMTMEDGSVSMEREQLSQMASRQITFIDHLEKAIMRIENKTYGICRITGKLIDKARLRAVPHATLSIEAKQMMNK